MPYPDFWILYNIIITRLPATFFIITARLLASFLYNRNQISCILNIFIIDKNFTNYVKIYEQTKNDF